MFQTYQKAFRNVKFCIKFLYISTYVLKSIQIGYLKVVEILFKKHEYLPVYVVYAFSVQRIVYFYYISLQIFSVLLLWKSWGLDLHYEPG
jgi:hypothetical protein